MHLYAACYMFISALSMAASCYVAGRKGGLFPLILVALSTIVTLGLAVWFFSLATDAMLMMKWGAP